MQHLKTRVQELETRTNSLIERFNEMKSDLKRLKEENQKLTETIHQKNGLIAQPGNRQKITFTKKPLELQIEDPIQTKLFINEMMREIDRCLLLLDR